MFVCLLCSIDYINRVHSYINRTDLDNHLAQHPGCLIPANTVVKCSILKTRFQAHIRCQKFGLHKCMVCGKGFKMQSVLYNHAQVHKKDKCNKKGCEFAVKRKSLYSKHMKYKHNKTKNFKCDKCDHRYLTPSKLHIH